MRLGLSFEHEDFPQQNTRLKLKILGTHNERRGLQSYDDEFAYIGKSNLYNQQSPILPHTQYLPSLLDEGQTIAIMDMEKLKRMQARGGVRTANLWPKVERTSLKKLNVQPIQAIEEVNMFKSDGNVIHFAAPKVHAAVPSNTFAIYGNGEDKELTELVPGILNQLGPDSLASLRKLAESYQSMQKAEGGEDKKDDDEDDDDIPDLVEGENFEDKVE
ncbi:hypothetical protein EYC84_000736 [Monilinia fructicola]|uniref:Nascent polypeptide-associated complex subunit beta n=1 Tax=Monilinia fructicola TaxID=38448 RepID=A0A5M9JQ14_MONFR|nr:hypothetical protein EYC84_000736 [Monilinia fructicola]